MTPRNIPTSKDLNTDMDTSETVQPVISETSHALNLGYWLLFCFPPVAAILIGYKVVKLLRDSDWVVLSDMKWLPLISRFLLRAVRYPRQGRLHISSDLIYVAGGLDMHRNCTFQMTPSNHKLTVHKIRFDKEHLERYKKLCGYGHLAGQKKVPVCYPETLFLKPLAQVITSSKFCLSPLGLIHLRQTIKQHEKLEDYLDSFLKGEVVVKRYCEFSHGLEVDIVLRLLCKRVCIWEGTSTLLSRKTLYKKSNTPDREQEEEDTDAITDEIDVAKNCGVRYASLTGDWNPHHLYPWSAWLLGYRKPIAHGMWSLSRSLAQVERRDDLSKKGVDVFCAFKSPLYMPGRMAITMTIPADMHEMDCKVKVSEKTTGIPHANIIIKIK